MGMHAETLFLNYMFLVTFVIALRHSRMFKSWNMLAYRDILSSQFCISIAKHVKSVQTLLGI